MRRYEHSMHSVEAKIQARAVVTDQLHELTTLIAVGALAALGLFGVIAAATIPGHAASGAGTNPSDGASATTGTTTTTVHHHRDFNSGGISSSSGPPLVVSGGSH